MKKLMLMLLGLIVLFSACVSAADYQIEKLAINGLIIEDETVALDLGTRVQVDVWVKGFDEQDVKVKAWIAGYEYDDVQDVSETFQVSEDTMYRKELYLEIPRDLRLDDKDYKLYIEVYDNEDYVEKSYDIYIQENIHDVVVQDVIIRPNTIVDAGNTLAVKVRLENYGKRKEQDVKVKVSMPQLGTTSVTWVDLLDSIDSDDNSESTSFIPLNIPEDAPTGDFQLKVEAYYSNLHETAETGRMIRVKGIDDVAEKQQGSIVSINSKKELELEKETEYKVGIMNLEDESKKYELVVSGLSSWAEYEVHPENLMLSSKEGSEFTIAILPVEEGSHRFSIKVLEGGVLIKEALYDLNLEDDSGLFDSNRNLVLGIMIVVLVIALIATIAQAMRPDNS